MSGLLVSSRTSLLELPSSENPKGGNIGGSLTDEQLSGILAELGGFNSSGSLVIPPPSPVMQAGTPSLDFFKQNSSDSKQGINLQVLQRAALENLSGLSAIMRGVAQPPPTPPEPEVRVPNPGQMESFPLVKVNDFKKVIYNLLVDNHNAPSSDSFVVPYAAGRRGGFRFNPDLNPDKRLAELYALHIRKGRLDTENQNSVFIQDLYKFYLRACIELLSKYFEKIDKYTYMYDDIPLFLANGSLADAEVRIKNMKTRARRAKEQSTKRRKKSRKDDSSDYSDD